jgi:predicted GIY-YIG superfamily endonuclease
MAWYVYLLGACNGKGTYVGMTNNLDRRLKQHNGEQSGGAKATHGQQWRRICYVEGFPDQTAALQFEWAWKHRSRRLRGGGPLQRRMEALQQLLADSRPTAKAVPYAEYPVALEVVWDAEELEIPTL